MGLTELSLRRPLTMLMIILTLVIMGYRAYTLMKLDNFPKVDFPVVTVLTAFPGASPADIEDLIVKPIEDAVSTIAGIDNLNSISTEGSGVVTIVFLDSVDSNAAAIDVERQVASARAQLPADAQDPVIIKADINAIPVLIMTLSGPQSQDTLFELADNELKTRLQSVPGVASVSVTGGRDPEVQVLVDPAKLAAFGLAVGDVQQALAVNNVTTPGGSIEEGRQKIAVRAVGKFTSLEQIENIVVKDKPNGQVYLRDVATVGFGFEDRDSILRYNGREAVSVSVVKSSDGNTVEVVEEALHEVEQINEELPAGAALTLVVNNARFIEESVAAVLEDLILAVVITGLVILVFLHTIRSTFIVILAVPTSIISTFLVMWMLGFSLNQLTLLALTLVIGILVDDSIVVIENIERHLEMKKPPIQAARDGRSEIGLAAITITLVDVVVYIPVAFTSGIIGQFFYSYGITVAVAALFSLFIAFTLTPMLAALWLRDHNQPEVPPRGLRKFFGILFSPIGWVWHGFTRLFEASFNLLTAGYAVVLRFCLRNFLTQSLVVIIAIAALVGGIFLVIGGFVGTEFFPQQDDGQLRITVEMPPSTNLVATDRVSRQIEQLLLAEIPDEMISILTQVGTGGSGGDFGGGGGRASNQATINVVLVDKEDRERSTTVVVDSLRPLLARVPEAITSVALASGPGGAGSPIQVQLAGPDPDQLIELANQVEAVIKTVPGATDVKNTDAVRSPETQLVVDRARALDLDLSPAQVGSTLRTALSGSQVGSYDLAGGTDIDITLRTTEATRADLARLLQTPLKYVDNQPVLLDRVVNIESSQAPARITRAERQRVLTVGSGVTGRAAGDVTNDIETALQENVIFPAGYGFEFIGQSEQQRESFAQLGQAILLAIALIYILLVALYQSWLQPLAIMFSLPVTLVGAIGGLWLFDQTLNLISLLGIVLLTGVVTKNAILIVDFANQLRENQGYERKEALVVAGRLRLRAILMTTLTIIFALIPLLIGAGAGSETRAPMAAVVIGGLVSSTLLTLILIPVVYNFFDWSSGLASRFVGAILGTGEALAKPTREEATEEEEKKTPEGEKGKPSPPHPSPQPGSAMSSLNPTE